jgi:(S)-ureidoglycine aminohydrolase
MSKPLGSTRTVVKSRYALLTPDGFVPSRLPGWENATIIIHISPAMGAKFSQLQITFGKNGSGKGKTGAHEYFVYVLEGGCSVKIGSRKLSLTTGSFVFISPGTDFHFSGAEGNRLLIFQKKFEPLTGAKVPRTIVGHERDVSGQPFLGNKDARLKVLLPDDTSFDMEVNIFTYQPRAMLPFVETHIMEHGLLMLKGGGVYRLDAETYPVQTGDVIWMAPYCPQWFVATGKTPASYIYYKDVNRLPLNG